HDRGIGHDRQMRAVLLDRRDRKDGHRCVRVERGKLARLQLAPESFSRHGFTFRTIAPWYSIAAMRHITPKAIRPPFARYSYGVEIPPGHRILVCSGQLGIDPADRVPETVEEQT